MADHEKVKIELMSPINPASEQTLPIEENDTVLSLIHYICELNGSYTNQLLAEGDISPYVRVAYNGEIIDNDICKNLTLSDGDNIVLISSVRGG